MTYTPDDVDRANEPAAPIGASGPWPGDLVRVSYADPTDGTGALVVRYGTVIERLEDPPRVRVAYLNDPTDPIPLDQSSHERADAPYVELVTDR